MKEYKTHSTAETEAVGEALAHELLAAGAHRAFLSLDGEMGVGKTAFARGFARALGCRDVHSPTYTVVNEYRGAPLPVFHFDLYRIEDEDELFAIGFDDYLGRDGYILCEWSECGGSLLPTDRLHITLARSSEGDDIRYITIKEAGE